MLHKIQTSFFNHIPIIGVQEVAIGIYDNFAQLLGKRFKCPPLPQFSFDNVNCYHQWTNRQKYWKTPSWSHDGQ